jgi:hypothetical protein
MAKQTTNEQVVEVAEVNPVVEVAEVKPPAVMSEGDMANVTKTTIQLLNEQPKAKVRIFLPPDERKKLETAKENGKNVEWPFETVSVNGHIYQIQRGVDVEVPQTVKEILENAGLI